MLPKVQFDIMNTVNASTGVFLFILKTGRSPHVIPPLSVTRPPTTDNVTPEEDQAQNFMSDMEEETNTVKDSLIAMKIHQAHEANKDWSLNPAYKVRDKVLLATAH